MYTGAVSPPAPFEITFNITRFCILTHRSNLIATYLWMYCTSFHHFPALYSLKQVPKKENKTIKKKSQWKNAYVGEIKIIE